MSKAAVTRPQRAVAVDAADILADLRELIHSARQRVATVANAEQTLLYWRLGRRIASENLIEGRAEYGKQILATMSQELVADFGNGFSYSALTRMVRFAELFSDEAIVVSLLQQLGWAHFLALLPIKEPLAREFYAEMGVSPGSGLTFGHLGKSRHFVPHNSMKAKYVGTKKLYHITSILCYSVGTKEVLPCAEKKKTRAFSGCCNQSVTVAPLSSRK